jgi:hypothetical protein
MAAESLTDKTLLDILSKLEPGDNLDQSLRQLLVKKVRNDLTKYHLIDQGFQKAYRMDFLPFKTSEQMVRPSFRVEQDYFDWEMAVTMIDELEDTLQVLQRAAG